MQAADDLKDALMDEPASRACLSRWMIAVGALIVIGCGHAAFGALALNVVFDGDSVSAGSGAPPDQSPYAQLSRMLGVGAVVRSVAVSGRPVRECNRLYEKLVAPLYDGSAKRNVIAFHAGDNDIALGDTARQAYASFTDYVAKAHRQGWAVIVTTELDRLTFSAPMKAELAEYNALLLANSAKADLVRDYDRVPAMVDHQNMSIYSPDHIHPTAAGYSILAGLILTGIEYLDKAHP
jgi:lysophospholipase L1-like esterase